MKTAFLLNPRAKKGTGIQSWYSLEPEIKTRFPYCKIIAPADPYQLKEALSLLAQEHYERLIIVGGDGTVNRVLNILLNEFPVWAHRLLLGVLPMGTGNDLVRNLGFTGSMQKNLDLLQQGFCRKVDVGKVTYSLHSGLPAEAQGHIL